MCLVLESGKSAATDALVRPLARQYGGRVRFVQVDWCNKAGREAAEAFSIESAPAFVMADAEGHVLEKFEGPMGGARLRAKLDKLIAMTRR